MVTGKEPSAELSPAGCRPRSAARPDVRRLLEDGRAACRHPSSSAATLELAEPTGALASSVGGALSDLISEIEQDRDDEDIPGYAGVAVDAEHSALGLWWVGEPPNRIGQLIAAPPDGLVVRLHPADYGYATTGRVLDGLMVWSPVIDSASPESDGSGVEVETTAKGNLSLPNAAQLAEEIGMPGRIVVGEPPAPAELTRTRTACSTSPGDESFVADEGPGRGLRAGRRQPHEDLRALLHGVNPDAGRSELLHRRQALAGCDEVGRGRPG